jgi:hypothetical protein
MLALLLLALPLGAARAGGSGRIAFLTKQLQKSGDARVRAQAALMLGAAGDAQALPALCEGLADASEVVRSAAARGLEQLGAPGGRDCLQRAAKDPSAPVRSAVEKALASLEAPARPPELYIQMLPIADKTKTLDAELVRLADERLRAKLATMGTLFAPAKETKAAAKKVLKARKLKGYQLKVELQPAPSDGLKLHVVCFTYPEKTLLGEVDVKASGAKAADLIRALAPKVIDEAAETFEWSP